MALFVKDPEVDRLAERLATLRKTSKTEVVRDALRHALEREEQAPGLVERGVAFVRVLNARARPDAGQPVDRDFLDSLYGEH